MTSINHDLDNILANLNQFTGTSWKEVAGENHDMFNELPIWILLYDDSDLEEARQAASSVIAPIMDKYP